MKNILKFLLYLLIVFSFSFSVWSQGENNQKGFYITPKLALTSAQDQTEERIGYGFDFGYQISLYFRSEVSRIDFGQVGGDQFIVNELSAVGLYPVSDFASLFFGVGVGYTDNSYSPTLVSIEIDENYYPTVNLGIDYRINNSWSLVSKYHALLAPNGLNNVYAFELGFKYAFGSNKSNYNLPSVTPVANRRIPTLPRSRPNAIVPKVGTKLFPVIKKEEPVKLPTCFMRRNITDYIVKPNDYLREIARAHNMTFHDLKHLNLKYFPERKRDPNLIYAGEVIVINKKTGGAKECK